MLSQGWYFSLSASGWGLRYCYLWLSVFLKEFELGCFRLLGFPPCPVWDLLWWWGPGPGVLPGLKPLCPPFSREYTSPPPDLFAPTLWFCPSKGGSQGLGEFLMESPLLSQLWIFIHHPVSLGLQVRILLSSILLTLHFWWLPWTLLNWIWVHSRCHNISHIFSVTWVLFANHQHK